MKTRAKARVQITVEVAIDDTWGEDCSIGQVYSQAATAGKTQLLNSLKAGHHGIVTVGEPRIIGVFTEEAR